MISSLYTNTLFCLLAMAPLWFLDVYGTPRADDSDTSNELSHYENLIRKLDENNYLLKSALRESQPTVNEVDDFDYYMDAGDVQRAWSRDFMKKNEEYVNAHFVKLATENMRLVLNTAQCHTPVRKCLDVNQMDFGKPKSYWPNCALVHKCGHDSGCCKYSGHVCSPVETENIDLYFFSLEANNEYARGRVERLTFENHTRCDCRPVPQAASWIKPAASWVEPPVHCECPKDFAPVPSSLECQCDCEKKHSKMCKRIKKGKRSYHSKGCNGTCGPPACDYGEFKTKFGRCPRKNDKGKRRK